jgi:hypothetical protein
MVGPSGNHDAVLMEKRKWGRALYSCARTDFLPSASMREAGSPGVKFRHPPCRVPAHSACDTPDRGGPRARLRRPAMLRDMPTRLPARSMVWGADSDTGLNAVAMAQGREERSQNR